MQRSGTPRRKRYSGVVHGLPGPIRSLLQRFGRGRPPRERERAVRAALDHDGISGQKLAREHPPRQRVLDVTLNRATQRPRAKLRIPADLAEERFGSVTHLELDLTLRQARAQRGELNVDDAAELVTIETVVNHYLVQTIDELRSKLLLDRVHGHLLKELLALLLAEIATLLEL